MYKISRPFYKMERTLARKECNSPTRRKNCCMNNRFHKQWKLLASLEYDAQKLYEHHQEQVTWLLGKEKNLAHDGALSTFISMSC